ncbi:MAG: nucleoside phosphorylase [Thermoprotei archaeon]
MGKQYHIGVGEGEVAEYVLLPGDPKRVPLIAGFWDEAEKVGENRHYVTYTGTIGECRVSCCSTGIGGPGVAIAVEELARCGAKTFIRVGTAGAMQEHVEVGALAISDAAYRLEGTSSTYVDKGYPAAASLDVTTALIEAAAKLGYPFEVGVTASGDGFYSGKTPSNSFTGYWQSWMQGHYEDLTRARVLSGEMEAATLFTLARLFGLRSGCVCAIVDNSVKLRQSGSAFDPEKEFSHDPSYIQRAAKTACEAVRTLYKWDQDRLKAGKQTWHPTLSYKEK